MRMHVGERASDRAVCTEERDLDDRVVRANRAFYRLTGLTPEQTLGHDITALMHPQGEPVPGQYVKIVE